MKMMFDLKEVVDDVCYFVSCVALFHAALFCLLYHNCKLKLIRKGFVGCFDSRLVLCCRGAYVLCGLAGLVMKSAMRV